ncbi:hypothetical protein NJ7G_3230 [Natrinema sp. J7-2]|nr:hypothetical protein NJ7G_3230 [Natrinema sp. J7-2]
MRAMCNEAYTTGLCPTVDSYVLAICEDDGATCTVCGSEVEPVSRRLRGGR